MDTLDEHRVVVQRIDVVGPGTRLLVHGVRPLGHDTDLVLELTEAQRTELLVDLFDHSIS